MLCVKGTLRWNNILFHVSMTTIKPFEQTYVTNHMTGAVPPVVLSRTAAWDSQTKLSSFPSSKKTLMSNIELSSQRLQTQTSHVFSAPALWSVAAEDQSLRTGWSPVAASLASTLRGVVLGFTGRHLRDAACGAPQAPGELS